MPWLLTSLIATLASTLVLFTLYAALFAHYRHGHLAWWGACWAAYSAVLGLIIAQAQGGQSPLLPAMQHILALASSWLLLRGTYAFLGRRPPVAWGWLSLLMAAYAALGFTLGLPKAWVGTPVFLLLGAVLMAGGWAMISPRPAEESSLGVSARLAGWSMLLWGLHRADYPFLKDVAWFAPIGFFLASVLTLLTAVALLSAFFENMRREMGQARSSLLANEEILASILSATPVGVGMIKDRRVVWANNTAYRMTGYPPGSWIGEDLTTLYASPEEYARVGSVVYGQLAAFGYGSDETVLRKQDGSLLHCQVQVLPVSDADPDRGYIFAFTDLSARKAVEDELRRTSRVLRAIRQCQRAMLHARDEDRLMSEICRIVCEEGGYRLAWVGLLEGGEEHKLRPAAQWGHEDGYLGAAAVSTSGLDPRGRGPLGEALRSGRPQVVQDVHSDPSFTPWRAEAIKRGYASVLGLPLLREGRAFGVLGIYAPEPHAFSQEEIGFLEGLAQDLAFGLESLRLGESRRLHQTLVDTSPDTIMLIANGGIIVACNQAVAQRLGKSVDELVGTQVADHVPPEVGARRKEAGLRVLAAGQPLEFQEEARGRIYEYRMHPVADREGKPHYIAVYARDITERRANERELEASIQKYRTLTQHSLQGIAILESDPTHFAYVNPRMTEIFGYSAEEFDALGPDEMWKLVHPDDRDLVRSRAETRLAGQTPPPRYEFRILRKDGGTRWVEVFSALTEHRGKPASQLAYIDITERKLSEELLRQERERFRVVVENSPLPMTIIRPDGGWEYANPAFQSVFGYTLAEVPTGRDWFRLAYPDPAYRAKALAQWLADLQSLPAGQPRPVVFTVICRDGSAKETLFLPVALSDGKQMVIFEDITERQRAEQALRKAEAKYRMVVETTNDGIMVAQDGRPVFFNRKMLEITGFSAEEYASQPFIEHVHPEDRPLILERYQRRLAGEQVPTGYDLRIISKQGEVRWLFANSSQIEWEGRPAVLNTLTDFTWRKQAEGALRESEERFRLLSENSSDLVCLHDLDLVINYASPSALRILGYRPEELQGENIREFLHPDDAAKVLDLIARGARGDIATPVRNENRLRKKEGGYLWVESLGSPVLGGDGALKYILVVSRDITERKHNETTLLQMAAGVAHNFNNVLMAIMSNGQAALATLGRSRRDRGEIKGLLDNVIQGARSGRDVVQRLSRYVGGSRGSLDSQEVVDVGRLLRSLRRLVEGMGRPARESRLEVRLDLPRGLNVLGSGGELTEVFLNLAKNAMEAMPEGGRLDISGRLEDGLVVITFADQGPGVDEQALGRFFEPFYSTKGVAGQGLGLTVSRAIVAAHGGRMEASSQPGQGTTLTVRLPLAQAQASALSARLPLPERAPASWPLKVLLVEDEALVAMGIVSTLRKAGHQALHCSSLAQAVEDLAAFQPDLILCDLGLPDGAGWEVCSRLSREAALAGLPDTPLVVLSGWSSDQVQREGDDPCLVAAYLQKPVERARLLQVLALAAPGRRSEPEALD